ncbi:MAG: ABC transporter permease subunit [Clostridia bacterium]|nr:ABC transporter permease subunit [Clostridia bacterium]
MRNNSPGRLRLWAVAFWLAMWQLLAMCVSQELLLASPVSVLKCLLGLMTDGEFWATLAFSLLRIAGGFMIGCLSGAILGGLSGCFRPARELLAPFLALIRAIPVASFVIVALIWVPSRNLSLLISALIVWPVVYSNVLAGIDAADPRLIEMADVFRIPPVRRLLMIHIPQVMPYFRAAVATGMGLAWKSGVAAEVIGIPDGSIGERLYRAKIYLMTPELFAWTIALVALSIACEKLALLFMDAAIDRIGRI